MTTHTKYEGPQNWVMKKDLARVIGVKPSTIDYLMKNNPDFPRPRILGPRLRVWRLEEVERWIAGKRRAIYKDLRDAGVGDGPIPDDS